VSPRGNLPATAPAASSKKDGTITTLLNPFGRPVVALLLAVTPLAAQEPSANVRFGLPSPVKADPKQREDYLIERPQYTLSYNAETRRPNWVSWRLRKEDIGKADRGPFEPDPLLPKGFAMVTTHVHDGGGFDGLAAGEKKSAVLPPRGSIMGRQRRIFGETRPWAPGRQTPSSGTSARSP
jgi:endonuclease G